MRATWSDKPPTFRHRPFVGFICTLKRHRFAWRTETGDGYTIEYEQCTRCGAVKSFRTVSADDDAPLLHVNVDWT